MVALNDLDRDARTQLWREVLGQYPTGVAIVSALDPAGQPQGLVVGTFSSVSMDPPLISYMPQRTSRAYAAIIEAERFQVSILCAAQEEFCRTFAKSEPNRRFERGSWVTNEHGVPRLTDCVVWFDCVRASTTEVGDHDFVLGRVEDLGFGNGDPRHALLFYQGGYGSAAFVD